MSVQLFDEEGLEIRDLEDDTSYTVVAKIVSFPTWNQHYILANQRGIPFTHDKQYIQESKSFAKTTGLPVYQFIKVDNESFEVYIEYLKTKNPLFLKRVKI